MVHPFYGEAVLHKWPFGLSAFPISGTSVRIAMLWTKVKATPTLESTMLKLWMRLDFSPYIT
jgi:hypothetical protein